MLAGSRAEIRAQRDRKSKGRMKNDEPTFGVAGEVDNFRIADHPLGVERT
jgi:hypothetical protein